MPLIFYWDSNQNLIERLNILSLWSFEMDCSSSFIPWNMSFVLLWKNQITYWNCIQGARKRLINYFPNSNFNDSRFLASERAFARSFSLSFPGSVLLYHWQWKKRQKYCLLKNIACVHTIKLTRQKLASLQVAISPI